MHSACHPMLVNISMKFYEDILNGLKVIERTQFCHRNCHLQSSKEQNTKIYNQELWFLCSAHRLMLINISMKFHEDILNGFQVTERTRFCDGQTDRWRDDRGKHNMSLDYEVGRHKTKPPDTKTCLYN